MIKVDYDYGANIKQPVELGMSSGSSMNNISTNIGGIVSYVMMLVNGKGEASKVNGPMGPKFFMATPTKCKDRKGGSQDRYIYLNYVPTGTIPGSFVMPGIPGISTDYRGLLPGIIENIGHLSPIQIMDTLMMDTGNACTELTMETIDEKNNKKEETHFVSDNDIRRMDDKWFEGPYRKPRLPPPEVAKEYEGEYEGFDDYGYNNDVFSSVDANFANKKQCKNIYINLLGLVGIYILLKIMLGGRAH